MKLFLSDFLFYFLSGKINPRVVSETEYKGYNEQRGKINPRVVSETEYKGYNEQRGDKYWNTNSFCGINFREKTANSRKSRKFLLVFPALKYISKFFLVEMCLICEKKTELSIYSHKSSVVYSKLAFFYPKTLPYLTYVYFTVCM